jgi:hypothetical protein
MAWGGKFTRMTMKQRAHFLKTSNRSLPKSDLPDPRGIPKSVMRTLASENLSSDPVAFNARLQQLLAAYKLNGG